VKTASLLGYDSSYLAGMADGEWRTVNGMGGVNQEDGME